MSVATSVDHGLLGLLAEHAGARATGVLTAVRHNHRRIFCFDRGDLIYAKSNVIEEQFTATLSRTGTLDDNAIAQATQLAADRDQALHALLLEQGAPDAATLSRAMGEHVRWLLEDTCSWTRADFEFAKGRPKLDGEPTARLHGPSLVVACARKSSRSAQGLRMRIGPPDMRPVLVRRRRKLFEGAEPDPLVEKLLADASGETDVSGLVEASERPADEALRTIYALRLLGMLEIGATDAPAQHDTVPTYAECTARFESASGADHYGVLGLTVSAEREEVRDAYYYLAKRFHPDRLRTEELAPLASQTEAFFAKVTEAYNTLYDPDLRIEYDRQREEQSTRREVDPAAAPANLARQNYARGKVLIDKGRYQDAIQFLENAAKQDPSVAAYHLELGRVLIRNPRRRRDAEEFLLTALDRDPTLAAAYLALGQLCRKLGRDDEAIERFREVLRWDPLNVEAKSELAELGAKETAQEGRGFRNWFRK